MMRKIVFLVYIVLMWFAAQSQSNVDLRGDSIRVYKNGGFAEFVLRNRSKDSTGGVLANLGNGVTGFRHTHLNGNILTVGGDNVSLAIIPPPNNGQLTTWNSGTGAVDFGGVATQTIVADLSNHIINFDSAAEINLTSHAGTISIVHTLEADDPSSQWYWFNSATSVENGIILQEVRVSMFAGDASNSAVIKVDTSGKVDFFSSIGAYFFDIPPPYLPSTDTTLSVPTLLDRSTGQLYQTDWASLKAVLGGGGSENLDQVLVAGDTSHNNPMLFIDGSGNHILSVQPGGGGQVAIGNPTLMGAVISANGSDSTIVLQSYTGVRILGNTFGHFVEIITQATTTVEDVLALPNTGNASDTVATLFDVRAATGSISLPSLTNGDVWIGNGSNVATARAISGDATLSNTGVVTNTAIQGKGITLATGYLKYTGSAWAFDNSTFLTANQTITLSGDVTGSGTTAITTTIAALAVTNSKIANSTIDLTAKVTGVLPIVNGGTNVNAVTTVPTATAFAGWDANKDISAANFLAGFTSTATAASTTTLTVASNRLQYFTGSTTQTVTLPVVSTLVNGTQYTITNLSSGVVTVQTSGSNTIQAMAANTQLNVTVINTGGGTGTASWNWSYGNSQPSGSGVLSVSGTSNRITSTGGVNPVIDISASYVGQSSITTLGTITTGTWTGTTIAIANGGTAVTSVTTAPAATAWAGWDANKNLSANNFLTGYATTATAAGTTTLTVSSAGTQYFTGSTTQTVTLPVASTLVNGQQYVITNLSSGVVTVQTSGTNTVQAMAANTQLVVTVTNSGGGTGTASWSWTYINTAATGSGVSQISNSDGTLTISPTTGAAVASLALGHANSWTGQQTFGTSAPIFSTMTSGSVLFAGTSGLLSQNNSNFFWDNSGVSLLLGSATTISTSDRLQIYGSNIVSGGAGGNVFISNSNSATVDNGGSLAFGITYTGTSITTAAQIAARKVNSSAGDFSAYLQFSVRDNSAGWHEAARFTSLGHLLLNTTTDNSFLTIGGGVAFSFSSSATGATADGTITFVELTATGQTETLPTAVGIKGRAYFVKLIVSGTGTVATTSSQTIDGSTTYSLASQYKYVFVVSNGSNWDVFGNN